MKPSRSGWRKPTMSTISCDLETLGPPSLTLRPLPLMQLPMPLAVQMTTRTILVQPSAPVPLLALRLVVQQSSSSVLVSSTSAAVGVASTRHTARALATLDQLQLRSPKDLRQLSRPSSTLPMLLPPILGRSSQVLWSHTLAKVPPSVLSLLALTATMALVQ